MAIGPKTPQVWGFVLPKVTALQNAQSKTAMRLKSAQERRIGTSHIVTVPQNAWSKAPFTCADLHTVCKLYMYV